MLLHTMGLLVLADDVLPLNEWRDVLFEQVPRPDIEMAMAKVEKIARSAETKPYDQLRAKWRGARRLFLEVVTRIDADGNATVMLNRPEVHNAFDPAMTQQLTATLKKLDADPKVRAVVLLGAGKNTDASGLVLQYWNGSAWTAISGVTDGTAALARLIFQNLRLGWIEHRFFVL
jgi:hypothetical protein